MIAEIIELFVDDSVGSDSDEDDSKDKVAIRLYALPEDTPNGRNHNHGEVSSVIFVFCKVNTCFAVSTYLIDCITNVVKTCA